MVAFTFRMPSGIPGVVTRLWEATIEPIAGSQLLPTPAAYGLAASLDSVGNLKAIQNTDTAIYGFLVKPFPASAQNITDTISIATPPSGAYIFDVLKRGYMTVLLGGSTAAVKGGAVYVWIAASSGAHVQGQVEAASGGGSTLLLSNTYFMGAADGSNNVEIGFNI